MAAMMISGSICFSRLICSICWYSRFPILFLPWPLQLNYQARLANSGKRHGNLAIPNRHLHNSVRISSQPSLEVRLLFDGLSKPNSREPPNEPLVVTGLDQLSIHPGGADLQDVPRRSGY